MGTIRLKKSSQRQVTCIFWGEMHLKKCSQIVVLMDLRVDKSNNLASVGEGNTLRLGSYAQHSKLLQEVWYTAHQAVL